MSVFQQMAEAMFDIRDALTKRKKDKPSYNPDFDEIDAPIKTIKVRRNLYIKFKLCKDKIAKSARSGDCWKQANCIYAIYYAKANSALTETSLKCFCELMISGEYKNSKHLIKAIDSIYEELAKVVLHKQNTRTKKCKTNK